MSLGAWQERLDDYFGELAGRRRSGGVGVFALEHGLDEQEVDQLAGLLRGSLHRSRASRDHWLAWVVYAAEQGYDYLGDEYWPSFGSRTPRWDNDDRPKVKRWFERFHTRFGGVRPSGRWADCFTIISWPITHAILPRYLQRHFAKALYDARHALFAADSSEPSGHRPATGCALASRFRSLSSDSFSRRNWSAGSLWLFWMAKQRPATCSIRKRSKGSLAILSACKSLREWLEEAKYRVGDRFKGIASGSSSDNTPTYRLATRGGGFETPVVETGAYVAPPRGRQMDRRNGMALVQRRRPPLSSTPSVPYGNQVQSARGSGAKAGGLAAYRTDRIAVLRSYPDASKPLIRFERPTSPRSNTW